MGSGFSKSSGWTKVTLGEVVQPRKNRVDPAEYSDSQFIGMDNVESESGKILGSISATEVKSSASRFFDTDVIYGRLRPYLNKVAIPGFSGLASAEFIVLPENDLIFNKFLQIRLMAADFVNFASHLNEGDRPRVNFDQISSFEFQLPPRPEQRRIVAKIEELFSELDDSVTNLETARARLQAYRQSLLKHAFEGRLTEQWRRDHADELESADQLLERIREERQTRYQQQLEDWKAQVAQWEADGQPGKKPRKPKAPKKQAAPTEEELEDLPFLPPGWSWVRLGEGYVILEC